MSTEGIATDVPKPPAQFHDFGRLPTELRWTIWEMAIWRDRTPRIHYYALFNDDSKGHRQSHIQSLIDDFPPKLDEPHPRQRDGNLKFFQYPMLRSMPSHYSWTRANRFQYYWNAGLRTACTESRANLSRVLGSKMQSHMVRVYDKGQHVYLEICRRDIVCLRFSPEDMVACVSLRWDILLTCLPFFQLPEASDLNLAFDFHDSWDEGLEPTGQSMQEHLSEASNRGLVMRAYWDWSMGKIPRWTRIWLIDRGKPPNYKLGRTNDGRYMRDNAYMMPPSSQRRKCHIFIDGKNRYVQTWDPWWDSWRDFAQRDNYCSFGGHEMPIHSFIWKLRMFCNKPEDILGHTLNAPGVNEFFQDFTAITWDLWH